MTALNYAETLILQKTNERVPEGCTEVLKDCRALAPNLLSQAINGETIKRCWDCSSWIGRCTNGKIWHIARDEACNEFSPRKQEGDGNVREN